MFPASRQKSVEMQPSLTFRRGSLTSDVMSLWPSPNDSAGRPPIVCETSESARDVRKFF